MDRFDIMIDLEGLGTNPWTTPLLQIGACLFHTGSGRIVREFLVNVDPADAIRLGAIPDQDTEDWWSEQGGFFPADGYPTLGVVAALEALSGWVNRVPFLEDQPQFWAQGTVYDFGILEGLFRRHGIESPWVYNAVRDLRTLQATAEELGWERPDFGPTTHQALEDCLKQVKLYTSAMGYLRGLGKS